MATVVKDFKIKNGLVVEGTTGTIDGQDILTKKTDDQNYIVNLIGGTATSANEANKVVKRDGSGNFAAGEITADLVGDVTGNADTATTLENARTISLAGDVTGSVSFDGSQNVTITATVDGSFATDAEVATAKGEAISDAAASVDSKIGDNTVNGTPGNTVTNRIATAASSAESNANTYTDNSINALDTDDIEEGLNNVYYTDTRARGSISGGTGISYNSTTGVVSVNTNDIATVSYVDTEIADLVGSAPQLLDTLQELAAAISNNPSYATDVANLVAGKQDTLTAGSNISIDGNDVISVTGLTSAEISDFNTAALSATSAAYDVAGAATQALSDAEDYADGLAVNYDAAGSASAAQTAAQTFATNAINALDTDDIEEGATNLYFESGRAKTAAAELLTGATLTNIQITGNGSGLTITAENGVADSDTDDLEEGSTNLYFTNARAVSALEAVTPDFPAVEIANIAKQVAAQATVATASTNTAVSWAVADYKSAEFLVKIAQGTHTEVSKVILTLDTSNNIAITEYAMVGTNGSLGSVSADVSGSDVRLRVTTDNNNSTVAVVGTLLK
jgi:hypothetical protein